MKCRDKSISVKIANKSLLSHVQLKCWYNQTSNTALHLAAANGYSSIVSDLISSGAGVDMINKVMYSQPSAHFHNNRL